MSALVIILLGTVLIQGSSLVIGGSRPAVHARLFLSNELREAAFTVIAITLSAALGFAVTHYLLEPFALNYFRTPAIVLSTAAVVVSARSWVAPIRDRQHEVLVLLTDQCALLGLALFSACFADSIFEACLYGFVAACALAVLSVAFKLLMERIDRNAVPFVFRGIPLALISAGLMALALMGFAGIIRN